MANTICRQSLFKSSATKPLVKYPPKDKTLGLESAIHFYELEDGDETGKGEEAEIFIITIKA